MGGGGGAIEPTTFQSSPASEPLGHASSLTDMIALKNLCRLKNDLTNGERNSTVTCYVQANTADQGESISGCVCKIKAVASIF